MQHFEGIGSEFQWHKPSFIAAHFLKGKWIGNLTNGHFIDEGDQSSYFGLRYSHCDDELLFVKIYEIRFSRKKCCFRLEGMQYECGQEGSLPPPQSVGARL